MSKTTAIIVALVVILGGAYLLMNSAPKNVDTGSETGQQDKTTNAEGRVVFSVTDVATDMSTISELNMKGSGEYVFAPVVKTESRSNADVTVGTNSVVTIGGGKVDDENTSGMD